MPCRRTHRAGTRARVWLLQAGRGKADVLPKLDAAIDAGFAWLGGGFPTEHPSGCAIDATCFAVLFLKKATLPSVTGR